MSGSEIAQYETLLKRLPQVQFVTDEDVSIYTFVLLCFNPTFRLLFFAS